MNVAYVVHRYDFSEGTGGYVAELLPRVALHHDVTLYATGITAPVPEGVQVVRVPAVTGRAYSTILSFPLAFRAKRRQHDVVHAQGWVASRADVVTAHIVMAAWREAARAAKIVSPPGERYLGGFVQRREARLLARGARFVIAPSRQARDDIAHHYGRHEGVSVIPHGFRAAAAAPAKDVARTRLRLPSAFLALFVGDVRKGLDVAIEAVAGTPNTHLAIVSRSSSERAKAIAQRFGAADRVHWVGGLDDPAIAYAAADVLLHPTIYDSFGLVVAEAMAHGVPPIVTSAAGISELIKDKESGFVIEAEPVAGTKAALAEIISAESTRTRMAKAARECAAKRSWDVVAQETLAIYQKVADR